jgi:polar amino acid transport system substrate-binding protein
MNARMGVLTALLTAMLVVTGCTTDSAVPPGEPAAGMPSPEGAVELSEPPEAPPAEDCGDPTASLRPQGALPAPTALPAGSTMAQIRARGTLIAGVNQNTYNFGYRDPFTGEIAGFEVEIAKRLAQAIFGTADALQLRVLTSAQRIPALEAKEVDLVISTMTINCERLEQIEFSSVYYEAIQQVLVKTDSEYTGLDSLGGKKVCAAEGSTSLRRIAEAPSEPVAVQVPNWTDCLVMLQQNQIEAVSTDDTILAGFKAQDPFTKIVGDALAAEPYGIGVNKEQTDLVRFVNAVLEQMRADGSWGDLYGIWVADLLDREVPAPPAARYRD